MPCGRPPTKAIRRALHWPGPPPRLKRAAAETTKFQAKFGKARNLGERSIGHQDPGATSMAMLLAGFAEGAAGVVRKKRPRESSRL